MKNMILKSILGVFVALSVQASEAPSKDANDSLTDLVDLESLIEAAKKVQEAESKIKDFADENQNEVALAGGAMDYAQEVAKKSWEMATLSRLYAQLLSVRFIDKVSGAVGGDKDDAEAVARYAIPSVEAGVLLNAYAAVRHVGKWRRMKVKGEPSKLVGTGKMRRATFFIGRGAMVVTAVPLVIEHSKQVEVQLNLTQEGYDNTMDILENRISELASEIAALRIQK